MQTIAEHLKVWLNEYDPLEAEKILKKFTTNFCAGAEKLTGIWRTTYKFDDGSKLLKVDLSEKESILVNI